MALDILVAVLLACTIGYAFLLNRRLAELKRDKTHLEQLAASFNDATARAEESVAKLRVDTDDVVQNLRSGISEAETLRDDLKFLVERGETTADRLEEGLRAGRSGPPAAGAGFADRPAAAPNAAGNDVAISRNDAERELIKALQAVR